jgi:Tol biopolymer transport system component
MGPDGSGRRALAAPLYGTLTSPVWAGDSSQIVYGEMESFATGGIAIRGAGQIVRQDISSGKTETLMWVPALGMVMDSFGPGRLILDSSALRANLLETVTGGDAGATAHRWRTRGSSIDRQPAFSPDGQWVIFSSNRSGNLDLWKLSIATGAVRRITEDAADDWDPAFMPDGRNIVWSSSRNGHFEIWIGAADGTGARQLTNDGLDAENPTATPDGRLIVYNSSNPAHSGLWTIRPDGSDATRLVPGVWSTPEVSPDGRWVAFRSQSEPRTVRVASLADGKVLPQAAVLPGANAAGRPRWLPGGRRLAFTGTDASGAIGVFAQDFDPGRDTTATRAALSTFDRDLPIESFGISPDGTRIVYAAGEDVSTLLLAEGVPGILPPPRPR